MNAASYSTSIVDHYSSLWSEPLQTIRFDRGPVHQLPEDFRVLVFRRSADTVAYATSCMSQPTDTEPLELHVLCHPGDMANANLVELLTVVAHHHRTGATLGLGHSVNFGKPWISDSACTYGVISLPYLDGPALEWMVKPRVRFLWLIPTTPAEIKFKKEFGTDALEERFEAAQFNYLDPLRPSVV